MGACCSKKSPNKSSTGTQKQSGGGSGVVNASGAAPQPRPQPAAPPASGQGQVRAPPVVRREPSYVYKPEPKSRKLLVYSRHENKANELPVSIPFTFYENAGICALNENTFFIAGGFENEQDEFTSDCMLLEANLLLGTRKPSMPEPTGSQTLLYYQEGDIIFAVGGMQKRSLDESSEDGGEYQVGTFAMFDLGSNEWTTLAEMPLKNYCCPTCYSKDAKIYAAGGFLASATANYKTVESVQIYDIGSDMWNVTQVKYLPPVAGAQAYVFNKGVLILGGITELKSSSKVFLYNEDQPYNFLKEFTIPNMQFISPHYEFEDEVCFLAEPDYVVTFNKNTQELAEQYLRPLVEPVPNAQIIEKTMALREGIYVYHHDQSNRTLYEFNTRSNEKTLHQLQNIQYRDAGIVLLRNGCLFFAGGVAATTNKPAKFCFIYNPVTKQEDTNVGTLPEELRGLRLIASESNVYAIAGYNHNTETENEVFCLMYKMATKEWTGMKSMIYPVRYPAVAMLGEFIYAVGGEELNQEGDEEIRDFVQVYDLKTNVWGIKECKYPILAKNMGTFTFKKSIIIFGGENEDGECVNESYMFDGDNFTQQSELPDDSPLHLFNDPPCYSKENVYVYSSCGELYSFDKGNCQWQIVEIEELTNNQI